MVEKYWSVFWLLSLLKIIVNSLGECVVTMVENLGLDLTVEASNIAGKYKLIYNKKNH